MDELVEKFRSKILVSDFASELGFLSHIKVPGVEKISNMYVLLSPPDSPEHRSFATIGDAALDLIMAMVAKKACVTPKIFDKNRQSLLSNNALYEKYKKIFGPGGVPGIHIEDPRDAATFLECMIGILWMHSFIELDSGVKFNDTKFMKFMVENLF